MPVLIALEGPVDQQSRVRASIFLTREKAVAAIPDIRTRREIEFVLTEWSWLIDHGKAQEASLLYTHDAEQSIAGATAIGAEAIAQGLKRRADMTGRTSRHVISNLRLSMSSEATVLKTAVERFLSQVRAG